DCTCLGHLPEYRASRATQLAAAPSHHTQRLRPRDALSSAGQPLDPTRLSALPRVRRGHWMVRVAVVKSILPLPPPTSTRTLASSMLPSLRPKLAHCLKCSAL